MEEQKKVTLSTIIKSALPEYQKRYGRLPEHQWKVINNILKCGTEDLGMSFEGIQGFSSSALETSIYPISALPAC